jgi:pyocin large subunit-like protein
MSIQAVGWVLEYSPAKKSSRLVLISLANHANADGRDAYPSIATIMRETLLPERTVQYALRALEEVGLIRARGRAPDERIPQNRRPVNYQIVGVQSAAPQSDQGCEITRSGVRDYASRGAVGGTQTVLEPSRTASSPSEEENDRLVRERFAEIDRIKAAL